MSAPKKAGCILWQTQAMDMYLRRDMPKKDAVCIRQRTAGFCYYTLDAATGSAGGITQENDMPLDERVNAALDRVLKAAGSARSDYTAPTLDRMREEIRKMMAESYIAGSNDNFNAMKKSRHNTGERA